MAIPKDRLVEILSNTYPSCGIETVLSLPSSATVSVMVDMTVAEWRELNKNIIEESEGSR